MPSLQEHTDLLQRLSNNLAGGMALETGASRPPVQALDLVGQHNSRDAACRGEEYFKGVSLDS